MLITLRILPAYVYFTISHDSLALARLNFPIPRCVYLVRRLHPCSFAPEKRRTRLLRVVFPRRAYCTTESTSLADMGTGMEKRERGCGDDGNVTAEGRMNGNDHAEEDLAFFDFLPADAEEAVVAADFFAFFALGASAGAAASLEGAAASTTALELSSAATASSSSSASSSVRSRFFSSRPLPSLVALRSALRFALSSSRCFRSAATLSLRSLAARFSSSCAAVRPVPSNRSLSAAV